MPKRQGGKKMKIQQISRFRTGFQQNGSGYKITGTSKHVTKSMEEEFTGMFTMLTMKDMPEKLPYLLDVGYSTDALYLSHLISSVDFKGRKTPYAHGLILDASHAEKMMKHPEIFLRFSEANFAYECNVFDLEKKEYPEMEQLAMEENASFHLEQIKEKYAFDDESFFSFICHVYDIILNEKGCLYFGWNQAEDTYVEVIKDMMFLVYSILPNVLRSRVSFSNYQLNGMRLRRFSVCSDITCSKQAHWYNLITKESSKLPYGDEKERKLQTEHLRYLVSCEEATLKKCTDFLNSILLRSFKRPNTKSASQIGNMIKASLLCYKSIWQECVNSNTVGRLISSFINIHPDNPMEIDWVIIALMQYVAVNHIRLNKIQFKKLKNYAQISENPQFHKTFLRLEESHIDE